jgi:hypothetical protein
VATTQLDVQLGIKKQADFATPATVDQFVEVLPDVAFNRNVTFIQSKALRVGSRVNRSARRLMGTDGATASVPLEAPLKGLGVWLEAAFGDVTNAAVTGASGAFQQVHTPKAADPINVYTLQLGVPVMGGAAASPMTLNSAWCTSIEFDAKVGEILQVRTEWSAKEIVTTTALATASYPTGNDVFTFCHGSIYLGGTLTKPTTAALATTTALAAANVVDFNMKLTNDYSSDEGRVFGGACKVTHAPSLSLADIAGKMTVEYTDNVLRDAYMAQTDLAVVLNFIHTTTIGTGTPVPAALQLVVPVVRLDGDVPKPNGVPVTMSVGFTGLDGQAASTAPIYAVYRTTDTTP